MQTTMTVRICFQHLYSVLSLSFCGYQSTFVSVAPLFGIESRVSDKIISNLAVHYHKSCLLSFFSFVSTPVDFP
jgi:hypothetical protein